MQRATQSGSEVKGRFPKHPRFLQMAPGHEIYELSPNTALLPGILYKFRAAPRVGASRLLSMGLPAP